MIYDRLRTLEVFRNIVASGNYFPSGHLHPLQIPVWGTTIEEDVDVIHLKEIYQRTGTV
jgi:hypothetical protein